MKRSAQRPTRAPTLTDVAKQAGVSRQTAGAVLGGKEHLFRSETIDAVRNAMEVLGYRPSAIGQALRQGRSGTIGLIQDRLSYRTQLNPRLLSGLEVALTGRGLQLIFAGLSEDADPPDVLRRIVAEGFLINYHATPPPALERALTGTAPAVFLNVVLPALAVSHDERQGAFALTTRCFERFGSVGWIHGRPATQSDQMAEPHHALGDRRQGYLDACADAKTGPWLGEWLWGVDQPAIVEQLGRLVRSPNRPRCLILDDGLETCFLAHIAAAQAGLEVPRQVAFATFGDHHCDNLGWLMPMALRDWNAMARAAVAMLCELLDGASSVPSQNISLQHV